MRHRVYGKHLSRDKNQRTALFRSLVGALFIHGSIETTESKAKSVKALVDKIINQAKNKNTQRLVQSFLIQKPIQEKLIKEIGPALKDRTSGYTSIVRLGSRPGDGAMIVKMSLLGNISKGLPEKKEVVTKETKLVKQEEKQNVILESKATPESKKEKDPGQARMTVKKAVKK